jgi:hypothetical protein
LSEALAALWRSLVEGRPLDAAVAPLLAGLVAVAAAGMVLEIAVLLARHRRGDRRVSGLLPTLLAGLCLMLALLSALAGAPTGGLLVLMGLAGIAHAADLWQRWPRA